MSHRYGRHGFDAWNRLKKQRIKRFSSSLIPNPHVVVVHIHFTFANRERIFVVTLDENTLPFNGKNLPPAGNVVDSSAESVSLPPDPLAQFKERARLDGALQARKDLSAPGDLPSKERLIARAKEHAMEYAYTNAGEWTRGRETEELERIYAGIYMGEYDRIFTVENRGRAILIQNEKRAQGIALRDKARDIHRGQLLTWHRLDYQAAIRAQEMLRLDIEKDPDYISQIEGFVKVYTASYSDEKEEGTEQQDRSDRFPGAPYV